MNGIINMTTFFNKLGYIIKYDRFCSIYKNRPIIDIFDFENQLHQKYGYYELNGKCMEDILNENYDIETVQKIMYYLGVTDEESAEIKTFNE